MDNQPKPIDFPWEAIRDFISCIVSLGLNHQQLSIIENALKAGKAKEEEVAADLAGLKSMVIEQQTAAANMNAFIEQKLREIEQASKSKIITTYKVN